MGEEAEDPELQRPDLHVRRARAVEGRGDLPSFFMYLYLTHVFLNL